MLFLKIQRMYFSILKCDYLHKYKIIQKENIRCLITLIMQVLVIELLSEIIFLSLTQILKILNKYFSFKILYRPKFKPYFIETYVKIMNVMAFS